VTLLLIAWGVRRASPSTATRMTARPSHALHR
jgi:hypothetical protein